MAELGEYVVILTPRSFMIAKRDWHIQVKAPDGREVWSSAAWQWTAELKARYIVRQMKNGKYNDRRKLKVFRV